MVDLVIFLVHNPSVNGFRVWLNLAGMAESSQLAVWSLSAITAGICHALPDASRAICLAYGGSALQHAQVIHCLLKVFDALSIALPLCLALFTIW